MRFFISSIVILFAVNIILEILDIRQSKSIVSIHEEITGDEISEEMQKELSKYKTLDIYETGGAGYSKK